MTLAALIAAMAVQAAPSPPNLSWMAGYWLTCEGGREVSETWSDPRGGVLTGVTLTLRSGTASVEFGRIAPHNGGLAFFAQPDGQPPAVFPLAEAEPDRLVFANPAHDFPQRVIYRREGDRLIGRIEGVVGDQPRAIEWRYDARPLNTRCPAM